MSSVGSHDSEPEICNLGDGDRCIIAARLDERMRAMSSDIQRLEAGITENLSGLRGDLKDYITAHKKEAQDRDQRIRQLEIWRAGLVGGIGVIVVILGWVVTVVSKLF